MTGDFLHQLLVLSASLKFMLKCLRSKYELKLFDVSEEFEKKTRVNHGTSRKGLILDPFEVIGPT